VTFQEWKSVLQESKEVRRQTADYTRLYRLPQGQTLSQAASIFYGDPALWRPIAIANQLSDPRRPATALLLRIPKLPYRDPDSGVLYGAVA
jgi:nucleoid-associated protein YgaU